MCRVLGCVAAEPVSIRHELLEAENPMIRQSEDHDSGWGMAVYNRGRRRRAAPASAFPRRRSRTTASWTPPTHARADLQRARAARHHGRPVAREHAPVLRSAPTPSATTARSCSFPRLLEPGVATPAGNTDSEHFFNFLMTRLSTAATSSARCGGSCRATIEPLAVLRAQLPVRGRRAAVRLPARHLRAALARRPGQLLVASRADHRRALAQRGRRTCCSCSTRTTSRSRTPSASSATSVVARADIAKLRGGLRPARRGARRGRRGARGPDGRRGRVSAGPPRAAS